MIKRKKLKVLSFIFFSFISICVYLVFFLPINSTTYFEYKTQYEKYENGRIKFYLVNDNPENGYEDYFFRISLEPNSRYFQSCKLTDFAWELRRKVDESLIFDTSTQTGSVNSSHFFENKIEEVLFKGISNGVEKVSLGAHDFNVKLHINPENECGFISSEYSISKTMSLKRKRLTVWGALMSI